MQQAAQILLLTQSNRRAAPPEAPPGVLRSLPLSSWNTSCSHRCVNISGLLHPPVYRLLWLHSSRRHTRLPLCMRLQSHSPFVFRGSCGFRTREPAGFNLGQTRQTLTTSPPDENPDRVGVTCVKEAHIWSDRPRPRTTDED